MSGINENPIYYGTHQDNDFASLFIVERGGGGGRLQQTLDSTKFSGSAPDRTMISDEFIVYSPVLMCQFFFFCLWKFNSDLDIIKHARFKYIQFSK